MLTHYIHLFLIIGIAVFVILGVFAVLRKIRTIAFLSIGGVILVFCLLVAAKLSQFRAMAAQPWVQPPETVTTAVAAEQDWESLLPAVGTLSAVQGVVVAAQQLDGNVAQITFQPGSRVERGTVLLQQDITSETAQLHSAEAAVDLARINLTRSRELLANATISQSQFDADSAGYKQAVAQADGIRATIAKKTIRAPFSGRLGIRLVNLGQTLKAGDAIVSLEALDPIFADFSLPEQDLSLLTPGAPVRVVSDAIPDKVEQGKITAINPSVDSDTRNVRAEATIANASELLHPGMFVHVSVLLPDRQKLLVIPAMAVLYAPYGDSVFVLSETKDPATGQAVKTVHQQFVRLGDTRGDFVAVVGGLKAGDEVVSAAPFKLRNGEAVVVNNGGSAPAEIAPKPDNS